MKIENAGVYWTQANIGNFFSSFFKLAYQLFSDVEFFKFYHQDITIIDKKGFLEISVYENVH